METLTGRELYAQLRLLNDRRHFPALELVEILKQRGKTIATAESCTGGLVSKLITDVPGASEIFHCGVCSYANNIKEKLLDVNHKTLERYGAVSPDTAIQMAEGVRDLAQSDIGVSTTGVAGPGGGSDSKPVGLVYVGYSDRRISNCVRLELWDVAVTREEVRNLSASAAIFLTYKNNMRK